MIESLESRRLLTGITHTGTFIIEGTESAGKITVSRRGNWIWASVQSTSGDTVTTRASAGEVKRLLVLGLGGDDDISVFNNTQERATIAGGAGDDKITGCYGATMIGGAGDDFLVAPPRTIYDVDSEEFETNTNTPQIVAHLSGGLGDDTISGDRNDVFVGGKGTDRAGIALNVRSDQATIRFGAGALADTTIRDHASGVELFNGDGGQSIVTNTGSPINEAS